MSSEVLEFKVPRFSKWLWILNSSKWIFVVDIPTQILLTIFFYLLITLQGVNWRICWKLGFHQRWDHPPLWNLCWFIPKTKWTIGRQVCVLFVCLSGRYVRETHLDPDRTRLKQNSRARLKSLYKHAGQLVYGNVKRENQIWRYKEMKEKKTTATPNKSSWTILMSAFGTRERSFLIQYVYGVPCKGCNKSYVGETSRQLGVRHQKDSEKKIVDKKVTRIMRKLSTTNLVDWEETKFIDVFYQKKILKLNNHL